MLGREDLLDGEVLHDDEDLDDVWNSFRIPPFQQILEKAGNNVAEGRHWIGHPQAFSNTWGDLGLNVQIDNRQLLYWLPITHPEYAFLSDVLMKTVQKERKKSYALLTLPTGKGLPFILDAKLCD